MGNDAKLGLMLGIVLVLLIAVIFFRKEPAASVPGAPSAALPAKKAPRSTPTPPAESPRRPVPPPVDELPKPRPVPAPPEEVPALPPPPVQ